MNEFKRRELTEAEKAKYGEKALCMYEGVVTVVRPARFYEIRRPIAPDVPKWSMTPRQRAELLTEQDKEYSNRFQQLMRDSQK